MVLDAGHGGQDTGAHGPKGLKEKDAVLTLAKALANRLEEAGLQVSLTRSDDTFVPLWERAKLANEQGADLFVSLHLNAAKAKAARGSEVYFLSLSEGDEESEALARTENGAQEASPAGPGSVIDSILDDLSQKAFLEDSERLAVEVQRQLNRLAGIKERGVKQAPFVVLRSAAMPAVLVETAFISNPKEELKLKDAAFVDQVAQAIAKGVRSYLAGTQGSVKRRAESAR
ncbi:MAG: N-acetylmuramoyl-L-alanine amidase [Acidobacteria bacterium]|nr:N-acetylmuramoyl-L-alanine amidase [Acidobacteriota bacterium]